MQSPYYLSLLLLGGCVIVDKGSPNESATDTDGSGQSATSASMPTGDEGSGSPTSAAGESTTTTTSTGGDDSMGASSDSASSGVFDMGPPPPPQCGGGTIEPQDWSEYGELWGAFDPTGLPRWTTSKVPKMCTEEPVAGLTSALVIRNDQLAQPRSFVTDGARWVVWSNQALTCDDPLDAPLCAGQWRISVAVSATMWCEIRVTEALGFTIGHQGAGAPLFVEVGDADCKTERFMLADSSMALVRFIAGGDRPPEAPQPMEFCADAPLPGTDVSPSGTFTAQICL